MFTRGYILIHSVWKFLNGPLASQNWIAEKICLKKGHPMASHGKSICFENDDRNLAEVKSLTLKISEAMLRPWLR
jgi:hypothetical protein